MGVLSKVDSVQVSSSLTSITELRYYFTPLIFVKLVNKSDM